MFGSFGKHCGEIGPIHFGGCFPAPGEGFAILRTLDQRVDAVAVQAQFTVEHDGRDAEYAEFCRLEGASTIPVMSSPQVRSAARV